MTATQVFFRFLKENGLYGKMYTFIIQAIRNANISNVSDVKLKAVHGDKPISIDKLLKHEKCGLASIFFTICKNSSRFEYSKDINVHNLHLMFLSFLYKNVKGNYFKILITDNIPQTMSDDFGRFRNGYHVLDYTWKETSKFYGTCN